MTWWQHQLVCSKLVETPYHEWNLGESTRQHHLKASCLVAAPSRIILSLTIGGSTILSAPTWWKHHLDCRHVVEAPSRVVIWWKHHLEEVIWWKHHLEEVIWWKHHLEEVIWWKHHLEEVIWWKHHPQSSSLMAAPSSWGNIFMGEVLVHHL